ncbi:MAG TPA: hypothetical protein VIK53_04505 [Verrucomicrobiae bacterium]|nr:hypothetical protein [Verrucomicrobiae bacterium]
MAIVHTKSKIHWSFFIALEQDVETMTRYIEPVPQNYGAYSLEMCRILFAAASECEIVLKELAKLFRFDSERFNIDRLREVITVNLPELASEKVFIRRYGLELDPWSNWRANQNPDWWQSYNSVKHQRLDNYDKGNLQNALNAVAALKVATVFYYRKEFSARAGLFSFPDTLQELSPESRLFFLAPNRYPSLLRINV